MTLPSNYSERVYAGVLGKIIGVYLGRPFEGWSYERLSGRFGEIAYYVHEQLNCPLIVSDDDISGTFTFLRAFEDFNYDPHLTSAQIGKSWLNYLIENKTVLWWGGLGVSTEHTAYLRLKNGVDAPASGSIAVNSQVVAEQIGAQIFIDGWGMINPGDPERAADFAARAARVSHDGEAVYGAQVVAALVASAFVESDIDKLLDSGAAVIPSNSRIARLIADIREWAAAEGDWRATFQKIKATYGYDKFGGGCHMIPNHALIIAALVHGKGDLSESLKIVNTCGWDTDCNSGNVGAILGVRNGLAGFDGSRDWRGPVSDRILMPTADGGHAISDAVIETRGIVKAATALAGRDYLPPKDGARFAFEFPGSVQGFRAESPALSLSNPDGAGLRISGAGRMATPTYFDLKSVVESSYSLVGSPSLYSGQIVRAAFKSTAAATARLFLRRYAADQETVLMEGPAASIRAGASEIVEWPVPSTDGGPICEIGVDVDAMQGGLVLDWLTWSGAPRFTLESARDGRLKTFQWVSSVDRIDQNSGFDRLIQNSGRGLMTIGSREWRDYRIAAVLNAHMSEQSGIVARYRGLELYYALVLTRRNKLRLIKRRYQDSIMAQVDLDFAFDRDYELALELRGDEISAYVDGRKAIEYVDSDQPFAGGGAGFLIEDGWLLAKRFEASPA